MNAGVNAKALPCSNRVRTAACKWWKFKMGSSEASCTWLHDDISGPCLVGPVSYVQNKQLIFLATLPTPSQESRGIIQVAIKVYISR